MQEKLFRALLQLLPEEFRSAYARDMEATFRAERRDTAGGLPLLRLWLGTAADILRRAPSEHADILAQDLRFALRTMRSRPLHTATALLTLALGLGANVAMFAVVDAVLLAPLPYREADRLTLIQETSKGQDPGNIGYLTFLELKQRARTLQAMAAATQSFATLTGDGRDAERVSAMRASASYLPLLGVRPALGRTFAEAEDRPGPARRVAILSDRLWRRRFAADPSVVGRLLSINDTPFTVVGVMPRGFDDLVASRLYQGAELLVPLGYDPAASFACRTCRHLRVFGRLAPGVSAADAERELNAILRGAAEQNPTQYNDPGARVIGLRELFLGPVSVTLLVLSAATLVLLLVACGNVANLLLLRASERRHEIAVRAALGVTPARLARQLVTESLLLALAGGLAGIPLAWAALRLLAPVAPAQVPRLAAATLDANAVAFALALVVLSGTAFGLVPLRQLLRREASPGLGGAGRHTDAASTWRLRSLLVGANMAMAVVLLVGSGLLGRSLLGLLAVEPGFDPARVLTLRIALSGAAYSSNDNASDIAAADRFYGGVLERVRALPGVEAASGVTLLPLGGNLDGYGLHIAGRLLANPEEAPSADRFVVTPGYFETLRIRLLRGRLLQADDRQGAPAVAVINRSLAESLFPGEDPLGHELMLGPPTAAPRRIVGVVGDVRHQGLDAPAAYQVYVPQSQWAWAETVLTLLVRGAGPPAALASSVRSIVREADPAQPITDVSAYSDVIARSIGTRRFAAGLLGGFAAAALGLAMVGLYGAVGVVVGQRQREIGVRLALGADAAQIRRMVVGQGMRPVAAGLTLGLATAALSASALRSLLFGIRALDPATFAASGAALLLGALSACAIPAWRASRTDASQVLRSE